MRLANIYIDGITKLCVKAKSGYVDIATALSNPSLSELGAFLASGKDTQARAAELADEQGTPYAQSDFAPLVGSRSRILCIGLNYSAHAFQWGNREAPKWPEVFIRHLNTVVGPYANLIKPALSDKFNFEGELGLVLGKGGRFIKASKAAESVAGLTVINDATARDWQRASSQWTCGKNFDSTFPIGPELVTLDEVDPTNLSITTTLNGQIVQSANTSAMIHNVWEIVEFLSGICTLLPGDIIATGTPAYTFEDESLSFLKDGDVVSVEIENIGKIINKVRQGENPGDNWPWIPPLNH